MSMIISMGVIIIIPKGVRLVNIGDVTSPKSV